MPLGRGHSGQENAWGEVKGQKKGWGKKTLTRKVKACSYAEKGYRSRKEKDHAKGEQKQNSWEANDTVPGP